MKEFTREEKQALLEAQQKFDDSDDYQSNKKMCEGLDATPEERENLW